ALLEIPRWIVDAYFPHGSLAMNRESRKPFADEHIALLERFTEVFALGHTRYLDLKAAEERARQAELERAVERVRAEALGMRTSDDLLRLVAVLYREMRGLGMEIQWANIYFVDEAADKVTLYVGHWSLQAMGMSWTSGDLVDFDGTCGAHWQPPTPLTGWQHAEGYSTGRPWLGTWQMSREEVEAWADRYGIQHLTPDFVEMLEGEHASILVPFAHGIVSLVQDEHHEEYVDLIRAFAEALSLGFVRFLDFQQLEERNRQMALSRARHRVRGEVLAMTRSDDIDRVVVVLREELAQLGVVTDQVGINIIDGEAEHVRTSWTSALAEGSVAVATAEGAGVRPLTDEERTAAAQRFLEHWRRREVWSRRRSEGVAPGAPGWVVDVPFDYGTLAMNRGQTDPRAGEFTGEEVETLAGFTDVVSLGYTRFLDFQKLEEQNRRLATESALERLRAEVASMQSTDDIGRIMGLALVELRGLGSVVESLNVAVVDEAARLFRQYVLVPHAEYQYGLRGTPAVASIVEAVDLYRGDRPFFQPTDWALDLWRSGESRISTFEPDYFTRPSTVEQYRKQFGLEIAETTSFLTHTMNVPFSHGLLLFHSRAPRSPGEADLATAQEFARMLSLGYARFLDFQAAEERARQLTMDRAVERVRAEATAMRASADIGKVMAALYEGWREGGLAFDMGAINIVDLDAGRYHCYCLVPEDVIGAPAPDNGLSPGPAGAAGAVSFDDRLVERGVTPGMNLYRSLDLDLGFARQRGWAQPDLAAALWTAPPSFPEDLLVLWGVSLSSWDGLVGRSGINVPFAYGGVFTLAQEGIAFTADDVATVERFADAVSLGYTRFLDLRAAELQAAQEAREAAAERVRAAAMSMRSADDLPRVVAVMFRQLQALGLGTPSASAFFANEERDELTDYFANESPAALLERLGIPVHEGAADARTLHEGETGIPTFGAVATSVELVHVDGETTVRVQRGRLSQVAPER
ncbi:MAG: hypothetical protein ABIL09_26400, partial [Gemmatimonadota bacterium]